jgi:hypothetical protein
VFNTAGGADAGAHDSADGGTGASADDDDGGADGGGGADDGTPAPDGAEIDDCKGSCDDLLFFDCLDADSHEACWAACAERTSADLEAFDACVDNTLPACGGCWDNLLDADPVGGDDDGGSAGGGDGGSVGGADCESACAEWVGAGCEELGEFPSCAEFCDALPADAQDFVVECVEARDGCTLPEECTFR